MNAALPLFGFLYDLPVVAVVLLILLAVLVLGYTGSALWIWSAAGALLLWGFAAPLWVWIGYGVLVVVFNVRPVRRVVLTAPIMRIMRALNLLPRISDTERTAIEAGTVWVEGEFFTGRPDFKRILNEAYPELTEEEQAFLDGPVEEVCRMTNDWDVYREKNLPDEVWDYLKQERFFGLIIPKEYGGLGYSALTHSAVIAKLASRSIPLTVTVMVPNSLGPAELLIHYGTEEQKDHYLPRLARGDEIPCFGLTEPDAGSDAASITSSGEVFRGDDGEPRILLNWQKRYITLASVSTIIGLAFRLHDPDNLLGKGVDLGITCAIIPSDLPGVKLGRRHDPLGVPFHNCPTEGENVVISVNQIIGGPGRAGQGWRMLMESLAAGRSISLPAQSTGGAMLALRAVGAYAAVRRQFGLPIGRFEGIEEPLARMGGYAYLMEAGRRYTAGAVDRGAKPSVVSAIAKYNFTELARIIANDAMDVLGGKGISRGPRNLLANFYTAAPIGITVEGANILTRTLIIFGQGVIRCHPYAYREIEALTNNDARAFDRALWGHLGFVITNMFRSVLLSLTRGLLAGSPVSGPTARYYRKLAWASATFALLSDLAMGSYGGDLKRKGKLTGRFADILSWMYLSAAVLRRFEAEGRRKEDLPFVHWSMTYALSRIQSSFDELLRNFRVPGLTWFFRGPVAVWSRFNSLSASPSDRAGARIAQTLQQPGALRDRLTDGMFIATEAGEPMADLETAFVLSVQAEDIHKKIRDAARAQKIERGDPEKMAEDAREYGIISEEEFELLQRAEAARAEVVAVDSFEIEAYKGATPQLPEG